MKTINFEGLTCYTIKVSLYRSELSEGMKCLILESGADPDYYAQHHFPPNKTSEIRYLSLPIKNNISCFQDVVIRAVVKIRKKMGHGLDVFPGQIVYENKTMQCIHIQLKEEKRLDIIFEELRRRDIVFFSDKRVKPYDSILYIKRHTRFLKLQDGVFQDADDDGRFFFEIPHHINFEKFLKGMKQIKADCDYHLFDSFLAHYFIKDTVKDFIGIYSKHCDHNRFAELKENIKRIF